MNAPQTANTFSPAPASKPHWLQALASGSEALIGAWKYPWLTGNLSRWLLWLVIAAACGARAVIGLTGTQVFSHDAFVYLDGAWRMLNGQRPHIDFFSNLGVLAYIPTLVGLWLSRGTAQGFGYGQALTGLAVGIWCYGIARSRLRDSSVALMCLLVVFMAVGPSSLGSSPLELSPGMAYNRCAYALIAIVLLEAFTEPKFRNMRADFVGGFSTGALTAILLFLKITYFVAAILLIVAPIRTRSRSMHHWIGAISGFGAVALLICAYFRFNLQPMLNNLAITGHARHLFFFWYFIDDILEHAVIFLAFACSAVLFLSTQAAWQAARQIAFASLAVCVVGVLIMLANYERSGFPLPAFAAVLIVDTLLLRSPNPTDSTHLSRRFLASVLVFASALFAVALLSVPTGLINGLYSKFVAVKYSTPLHSPALAGFVPMKGDVSYSRFVNDGLTLLQTNRQPNETIMCLDFSNPFSFALAARPAPGGATALQYKSTFNDTYKVSPERLFGQADLVMLPKTFTDVTLEESILRLYGPFLNRHFSEVAESSLWQLYRRNPTAP